jgi:hypothetical protein
MEGGVLMSRAVAFTVLAIFAAMGTKATAGEPVLPYPAPAAEPMLPYPAPDPKQLLPIGPVAVDPVAGNWVGSGVNALGHKGSVRAIFVPTDQNSYRGVFTGRFGVRPYRISCDLAVTARDGDKVVLAGKSFIGSGSGQIKFKVVVTPAEFVAEFTSPHGGGQITLIRN